MKKNYVFVDYENVQAVSLDLLDKVSVETFVWFLMGEHQVSVPTDLVEAMLRHAARVQVIRAKSSGKNALDFVLACSVGEQVAADATGYFHIVSKDKGFDAVVAHLKQRKICAARHDAFALLPIFLPAKASSPKERAELYHQHLVKLSKNRPAKRKTLESAVHAFFGKQLMPEAVIEVVELLRANGAICIDVADKVTYGSCEPISFSVASA